MEVGIIAGIIAAAGVALVNVIKALYGRNQNKKDQQTHEENLLQIGVSMNNVNQEISERRKMINDLTNGIAKDMDRIDRKLEDFHSEKKDLNIAMIRHDIVQVYEYYKSSAAMPTDIYESTMSLYDTYKKLGGNSFITEIVEEMKKWNKS